MNKTKPIEFYYFSTDEIMSHTLSDEENIIKYFQAEYGDNLNIVHILLEKNNFNNFCEYNKYDKQFVIQTIKNYINKNLKP